MMLNHRCEISASEENSRFSQRLMIIVYKKMLLDQKCNGNKCVYNLQVKWYSTI